MKRALEVAKSGAMYCYRKMWCTAVYAFKDNLSGRVSHGCRPGPKSYLQPIEEEEMARSH